MRPDYTKKIVEESLKFDIFNRGKKEVSIEYNRENCEVNYKFYHDRIPYMREPVTLDGIEFFLKSRIHSPTVWSGKESAMDYLRRTNGKLQKDHLYIKFY